jgi:aryl-alcohol dehydrogenase-like predicted oxidoreductase
MCAKLGLGTAQWGSGYGVANSDGQTSEVEAMAILDDARHLGIDVLDTASQYGTAEVVLGQSLLDGFRVITKTPSFRGAEVLTRDVTELVRTFEDSLSRLGLERIHGLLLHDVDNLFVPGGKLLLSAMEELKAAGKVEKIGVSVYDGRQIDAVLGMFAPDIVQLPLNVLDQRLLRSGHLARLREVGAEIHVRSVFLQGLLLMPLDRVPVYFDPIRHILSRWHEAVLALEATTTQAALAFIRDLPWVDVVLVGVENRDQLTSCCQGFSALAGFDARGLACDDPLFVNPTQWKLS